MKATATLTPGPWQQDECRDANGFITIRHADGSSNGGTDAEPIATVYTDQHARLITEAQALATVLVDLFEHCAMVHKHWGDGNNREQADEAIKRGLAILARINGTSTGDQP